jgi:hypothetical protein
MRPSPLVLALTFGIVLYAVIAVADYWHGFQASTLAAAHVAAVRGAQERFARLNGGLFAAELDCLVTPGECVASHHGESFLSSEALAAIKATPARFFTPGPIVTRGAFRGVRDYTMVAGHIPKRPWWGYLSGFGWGYGVCAGPAGPVCVVRVDVAQQPRTSTCEILCSTRR